MAKTLVFFPASGELFDVTDAPKSEVEISRKESFSQGIYSWIIYFN